MKNRITRYFSALKHPQTWNLGLIPVLSVLIFILLIYAILGYTSVITPGEKLSSQYESNDPASMHLFFGFLLLMVLIVWMFKIFRNNAFNQFLPITHFYLVKEFFAILLVVAIAFFTIPTYHYFQYKSLQHLSESNQIREDLKTMDKAITFIPITTDRYIYNSFNYNFNLKALENEPDLKAKYIKKIEELKDKNVVYSHLYCGPSNNYDPYVDYEQTLNSKNTQIKLNIQKTRIQWLLNRNVDSVEHCINQLQKTLKKYNIRHHLDAKTLAANVFINDQFSPMVVTSYHEEENFPNYIDPYSIERSITYFLNFDEDRFSKNFDLPLIFGFALLLSTIVFSARVINGRTWGFSWLAFAITTIAFALFMVLAALSTRNLKPEFISICFLILHFSILIYAFYNIISNENKFGSGIALNMVLFSLPFVVTHFLIVYHSGGEDFMTLEKIKYESTLAYTLIYMLLFVVFLYIPMVYRWKGLKNNT
jgi:hypothetical protein